MIEFIFLYLLWSGGMMAWVDTAFWKAMIWPYYLGKHLGNILKDADQRRPLPRQEDDGR